jgi:2-polyprenyl-6-methoxyphenol hydroxylase-like FAD-dependent oxidoreductase
MSGLRVAVAGGGLGGLCLAQGLLKAGVDVTVYERDPRLAARRQGYRLHVDARAGLALEQCVPAGSLALFQATCGEASTRLTVVSERLRVLNEQRRAGSADPYAPATLSTSVNRQTLREVLAAGLDGRLVFGCELTSYEAAPDGVRLQFADGRQAEADLLVGADGVGSAVCRQYLPAAAPADTGKRCIYGTTPLGPAEQDRLPPALRDGFTAVIGGAIGMATGLVRFRERPERAAPWLSPAGDYLMWAVAADRGRFGVTDERLAAMSPAELHALTAALIMTWHPDLRALHARAAVDETFLVRIRASPPVPPWPPSRVTVLGDAIHAMSPARGSGANTALRDAALLCRTLTGAERTRAERTRAERTRAGRTRAGLIAAVGEYERQMRDYGYAAVAASSRAEADTGMRHNRLMFWLYRRMTGTRG